MKRIIPIFTMLLIACVAFSADAFVVKTIFFKPTNAADVPDARISGLVKGAQQLYADEMELQGFGRKTFRLEERANGEVRVHRVNGRRACAIQMSLAFAVTWFIGSTVGARGTVT